MYLNNNSQINILSLLSVSSKGVLFFCISVSNNNLSIGVTLIKNTCK